LAWRAWLPDRAPKTWQAILLGAGLAGAGTVLRVVLNTPLGRDLPFFAYFPALIIASALGGVAGGAACLLVATAGAVAFVLPPGPSQVWAVAAFWFAGGLVIAAAAALADGVRELRASRAELTIAQARLTTLVGELAHRNRNALFVIMAIVSQSARGAQSAAQAERIINARLEALMRAQDVLLNGDGAAAGLLPLLERALEPFDLSRFDIAPGHEVRLDGDVAIGLGLLFHELATNALKYGALSAADGRVVIAWAVTERHARFTWRETGGPPVTTPVRQGFGARLIGAALVPQGGRADRRFEPDGVVCELAIPLPAADAEPPPTPAESPGAEFARQMSESAER
jgi:two-component sensor histidine kinase